MYSAHDGIHMPPVISYIVGVMSSTEWVWGHTQWMWWQIEWVSTQIYSMCCHTNSVCGIIYNGYDVINIVDAMAYKQWYDVINRGCDVRNSAYGVLHAVGVISYIHRLWYHQLSGCDYTDTVSVMSDTVVVLSFIQHVRCHIYWGWCRKHRRCLVIDTVLWCRKYRLCDFIWGGVLSCIEWMWRPEYSIVMS